MLLTSRALLYELIIKTIYLLRDLQGCSPSLELLKTHVMVFKAEGEACKVPPGPCAFQGFF